MNSRNLLYFIIGIMISFISVNAYAGGTSTSIGSQGTFNTSAEAINAVDTALASACPCDSYYGYSSWFTDVDLDCDNDGTNDVGIIKKVANDCHLYPCYYEHDYYHTYALYYLNDTARDVNCFNVIDDTDTDGDGLPDYCDMYPNDSTPYQVTLLSDTLLDGVAISQLWKTNRGDLFYFGLHPNDAMNIGLTTLYITPDWKDPDCDISSITGSLTSLADAPITPKSIPDTPPPSNPDPDLPPTGQDDPIPTDPTDDDSAILKKINDNLGILNQNQQRDTAYLKMVDASIKKMDNNQLKQGINDKLDRDVVAADLEKKDVELKVEAEAGSDNLTGVSVNDSYAPIIGSGELIEGADYETIGELSDETFITEFFNDNPLTEALNNSGFTMLNPVCNLSLDLGYLGSHEINLCAFESKFQLFGNLLLGFCGLTSLMLIVRR